MRNQKGVSRRGFVQLMGAAAVATPGLSMFASTSSAKNGFAYVGCSGGEKDAIEVFAVRGGRWTSIQRVASDRPVSMTLSRDRRFLYVVNEVSEYKGLPTGTVEAYTVARDGRIALLNRQALSLSATMPRHLAISPDGKSIVVTAQGGGAYNLMQIGEDGSVGRASGILKETGTETSAAQPQMAIFDGAGRVVSADQGTGLMSVLTMEDNGLTASTRSLAENGSGPLHIAMHSSGRSLYIAHEDSLQHFAYNASTGRIGGLRQHIAGAGVADGSRTLAVHPSGETLFACNSDKGITAWQTNGSTGALRRIGRYGETWGALHAIDVSHDGGSLTAISREDSRVLGATIDAATGQLNEGGTLARVESPVSLIVALG
ncbi:MAG: beta-propeller fold lactonase family protein [Acidobacteria bacterium]|nr:beta-propeller fold lactonase family protein [Acidobacteriota bacterium]